MRAFSTILKDMKNVFHIILHENACRAYNENVAFRGSIDNIEFRGSIDNQIEYLN